MGKLRTPEEQKVFDQILEYVVTMKLDELEQVREAIESILAAEGEEE